MKRHVHQSFKPISNRGRRPVGSMESIIHRTKHKIENMKTTSNKNLTAILALVGLLAANTTGSAITSAKATTIMSTASAQIGKKYVWGAASPTTGFDCSGLTQYSYGKAGITIPRVSKDQYNAANMCVTTKTKAALLFFATDSAKPGVVTHVTLNSGDGKYSIGANGYPIFDKTGKLIGNSGSVQNFNFVSQTWAKLLTCATSSKW
jgi:cell wall-associated NlpC family hydrolase